MVLKKLFGFKSLYVVTKAMVLLHVKQTSIV